MTKQDYFLIADICVNIAKKLPIECGEAVIDTFKYYLYEENENFDRDKFLDYISEGLGRQA